mmetsp:Transcript_57866/g.164404  ORF Transcript_57866/g.164404 Transcript_57866/m.164404 type:complete len:298 (-) Transcript_57866:250-1143(-)
MKNSSLGTPSRRITGGPGLPGPSLLGLVAPSPLSLPRLAQPSVARLPAVRTRLLQGLALCAAGAWNSTRTSSLVHSAAAKCSLRPLRASSSGPRPTSSTPLRGSPGPPEESGPQAPSSGGRGSGPSDGATDARTRATRAPSAVLRKPSFGHRSSESWALRFKVCKASCSGASSACKVWTSGGETSTVDLLQRKYFSMTGPVVISLDAGSSTTCFGAIMLINVNRSLGSRLLSGKYCVRQVTRTVLSRTSQCIGSRKCMRRLSRQSAMSSRTGAGSSSSLAGSSLTSRSAPSTPAPVP